jgi:hypothetical protein
MEATAELERGQVRLQTPEATWSADLCPPCSEQIRGDVTFQMKARKRRRKVVA